jgi:glutamyl-tRNA synthetase/glutamyl-Q tRNA(Asp) synthetase
LITTRFAPAPTGYLHLGHIVNAIYVWGVAHAAGGRVLLRIEDHDRQRSRWVFERAMLDDLDWLGFIPDEPSTDAFRAGSCRGRQSDRSDIYQRALEQLRTQDLVYACECSRRDIESSSEPGPDERRYPGTCAAKGLQVRLKPDTTSEAPDRHRLSLRVRLDPSVERFEDLRHGLIEQRPSEQCGDLLIRGRDGNWTYQFSAAVDDLEQGVNLVIRGDDLLTSTGRQIQLARLLGRVDPPRFLHHRLVMKTATQKLSKSDRDTGIRDLREKGWSAADVIGEAATLAGLIDGRRPLAARDVAGLVRPPFY